jgi:hypothetical protein
MADSRAHFPHELRLRSGVSLIETRTGLTNFCLSHFGADGQYYADVIELCADASRLQEALNIIAAEVAKRCADRMPVLIACVRAANDTDPESSGITRQRTAAPAAARPAPSPAVGSATPRGTAPAPPARPAPAPLQLAAGVSVAQARLALANFCLEQFGPRSQALVDAIDAAGDVRAMQAVLNRVVAEVKANHRDSLGQLLECVREINATSA